MKTIDEYAAEAKRAIGRWYGRTAHFDDRHPVYVPFETWIKAHWHTFPASDPTGGPIIDSKPAAPPLQRPSGDICQDCGSVLMIRTGTCLTCMACGSSSGGCS